MVFSMLDVVDAAALVSHDEWDAGYWPREPAAPKRNGISITRLDDFQSVIVHKPQSGCSASDLAAFEQLLKDLVAGRLGSVKFLVLDLANGRAPTEPWLSTPSDEVDVSPLVVATANLILEVPIVSVAWTRGWIAGSDLQLALACSMMAGEENSLFSFDADPLLSPELYTLLARKLGFVRAERLIERGEILDAQSMCDLLLMKEIASSRADTKAIESFLRRRLRRHNSACGIYKAQRIAMPIQLTPRIYAAPAIAA
jgi:hypothetical protein